MPQDDEPYRAGGFEPDEDGEGSPVFMLNGQQASEFMFEGTGAVYQVVNILVEEEIWFMVLPPDGWDDWWTLFVELRNAEWVSDFLVDRTSVILSRGLHNPDDDEEPDEPEEPGPSNDP